MSGPGPRAWEFSLDFYPAGETEAEPWACGQGCAVGEGKREKPGPGGVSQLWGVGLEGLRLKAHSPALGCGKDAGTNLICQAALGTILWEILCQEGLDGRSVLHPKG